MSEIKPAVSAELWARVERAGGPANYDGCVGDNPEECAHIIAMNNAALPDGDARKFTWDDVEHLRLVAGQCDALRLGQNHATVLRNLAERIEVLLPPREKAE